MDRIWRFVTGIVIALATLGLSALVAPVTAQGAWHGEYFTNRDVAGAPALTRYENALRFEWGTGSPGAGIPADNFSVVWTRQLGFAAGYYRFNVRSDDGVRVWLDDRLIMDYWRPMDYQWHYVDGTYLEGTHALKVEYFERTGSARIRFWWEPSGTSPAPVSVPVSTPVPAPGVLQQPRSLRIARPGAQ